ncbi:hypothetical protein [Bacillus sp. FJAT-27245]|uniref:hypothetical protein n=1 Tax=Bacillus sp. FJAT-27245 TaxID=1684144 RepID=UPI0006A78794|nr:hypothetical protein [Bacillus sp. FJAT-27245]
MENRLLLLVKKLEEALVLYEQQEKYDLALEHYREVELEVAKLIESNLADGASANKVLAQCYLRQAGMLRQLGRRDEANVINKKEIESAKLSGDSIAYAQSLFSTGINLLSSRQIEDGLSFLNEAKDAFEKGESADHRQGVGWYWLILADLGNKGMIPAENNETIEYATKAIAILEDIGNLPGIARAYEARSIAYKNKGDDDRAEEDQKRSKAQRGT